MKKPWFTKKRAAILPLLAVVFLYVTYDAARQSFFFCKHGGCQEPIPENIWKVLKVEPADNVPASPDAKDAPARELKARESTALRYSGRMTWYFLGMVYVFACLTALTVACYLIYRLFPRHRRVSLSIVIVSAFLAGLYLYRNPDLHMAIFTPLFKGTIIKDVAGIAGITNLLDCLGNGAAFALLLTSCATLLPPYKQSFPRGVKELSKRMKYLRAVLYAGTLLLVTTILLKKSLYQWSLAFTSREESAVKVAEKFVSSLLSVEGGFYTLVLVAVYMPAAVILQKRAYRLDALPAEEAEREKKLSEHEMTFSFAESLPSLLAILGPVLAGPVGELLSRSF